MLTERDLWRRNVVKTKPQTKSHSVAQKQLRVTQLLRNKPPVFMTLLQNFTNLKIKIGWQLVTFFASKLREELFVNWRCTLSYLHLWHVELMLHAAHTYFFAIFRNKRTRVFDAKNRLTCSDHIGVHMSMFANHPSHPLPLLLNRSF